jgi:hypothetical protein
MKKYFCISFILFSLNGPAQNINSIKETDIPGINILAGNSFSGKDMNDFLGSEADLYLEYGLTKLFINEYTLDKDDAILKIYIMANAPSALGIYSLSSSRCKQWNLFGSFSCSAPYHVAAASGSLFIYASNKTGSQSGQSLCEQLVKLVIDKNPQEIWYAPALIQSAKAAPFTNTLRYYKGPIGLKKGLPSWFDLLENLNFHMFTMNVNTPDYTGILARIIFPDESTLSSFIRKSNLDVMSDPAVPMQTSNGLYRSWYKINSTKILFMESNSPKAIIMDFVPAAPDYKWLEEE